MNEPWAVLTAESVRIKYVKTSFALGLTKTLLHTLSFGGFLVVS